MVSNSKIEEIFETKERLLREEFNLREKVLVAQIELKRAKTRIINESDPKELGKNDKEREAKIAISTEKESGILYELESALRTAELESQIAGLKIDCFTWQIRNNSCNGN
jgi:hypothetical protein